MKRKVLTFLTVLTTAPFIFGQITTTKVAPKLEQTNKTPYDSTQNFLGKDVNKYLGQELYLIPMAESLRKYGYSGFCLDYTKDSKALSNTYKPIIPENKSFIELDLGGGWTQHELIEGKYFKVIEIKKHPKAIENENLYGDKSFLKLEEKISKDIVYFEYDNQFEHSFPFIVVGFFEKQKALILGKKYVFADKVITYRYFGDPNAKPSVDIITGKQLTIVTGEKWKCLDLTVEEEHYTLSLVIQNSLGEKTTMNYNTVFGKWSKGRAYSATDADNYRKDFGSETFDLILKGKCKIGMTKEMCLLSWGEPKSINETITSGKKTEQWVYKDNYLYFDNGILKAMQ
jgi:hypothetical protein